MKKSDYYSFSNDIEEAKKKAIKLAHGISVAGRMVKVSGEKIKIPLIGRDLDAVYYPALDDNGNRIDGINPLIIGFHGGGFIFGGCTLDDSMWLNISKKLHSNVVSVGYRKSPDFTWKDTLKDGVDTVKYLVFHAKDFSADINNISLMGQSAGATLIGEISIKLNLDRKKILLDEKYDNFDADYSDNVTVNNVFMLYPLLDGATNPDLKGEGSYKGTISHIFNEMHCNDINVTNPLVSPIFASKDMLTGLPNTIIVYCENDNLKHEDIKYAKMLNEAGVKVSTFLAEGMPHAFFESGFKEPTPFDLMFLGDNGYELYENGALNFWAEKTIDFIRENMLK